MKIKVSKKLSVLLDMLWVAKVRRDFGVCDEVKMNNYIKYLNGKIKKEIKMLRNERINNNDR